MTGSLKHSCWGACSGTLEIRPIKAAQFIREKSWSDSAPGSCWIEEVISTNGILIVLSSSNNGLNTLWFVTHCLYQHTTAQETDTKLCGVMEC